MLRTLLAALVLVTGAASAQNYSWGVRYDLGGDLVANLTVETPSLEIAGFRAGPSFVATARVGPEGWGAAVQGGLTFVLIPATGGSGIMLDVLYRALFSEGDAVRLRPAIALYGFGKF